MSEKWGQDCWHHDYLNPHRVASLERKGAIFGTFLEKGMEKFLLNNNKLKKYVKLSQNIKLCGVMEGEFDHIVQCKLCQ